VSFLLHAFNLALIGVLPRVFFRSGRLNLRWWVTATPFLLASVGLFLAVFGEVTPWSAGHAAVAHAQQIVATALACGSIALMAFTLGTHRIPIALWHQDDDAPRQIVTWGAYARIRHPFYSSFLIALCGALIACPQALTAVALPLAFVILDRTARREEQRLAASEFGDAYRDYMTRTGRFLPRPGRSAA
jgi:protein-S-isoprenylcysteine O-methyltransferase Ste14